MKNIVLFIFRETKKSLDADRLARMRIRKKILMSKGGLPNMEDAPNME